MITSSAQLFEILESQTKSKAASSLVLAFTRNVGVDETVYRKSAIRWMSGSIPAPHFSVLRQLPTRHSGSLSGGVESIVAGFSRRS
jgi:hypothetical protein